MKKVFRFIFVLTLIIAAAAGILMLTFNADSYRPFFQQKLQEAIKKPVQIKKITLAWNGGIALDIDGLEIFENEKSQKPLVSFKKASVLVNAKPLLHREVQVTSVILESPEIDFVNTPKVSVLTDLAPSALSPVSGSSIAVEAVPQVSSESTSASAMSFVVEEIKIRNGSIRYSDPLAKSPVDVIIQDLDAVIRNISLTSPLDFKGKASLFSSNQNLLLEGKISLQGPGAFIIENILTRLQLETMETARILKSLPALQSVGLAQGLAGSVESSIKRVLIVDGAVKDLEGDLHLVKGRFKTGAMPLFFENGELDLNFNLDRLTVQRVSGNFASGKISADGLVQNLKSSQPQLQADMSLSELSLADVMPHSNSQNAPYMEGVLSSSLKILGVGLKDYEIKQTLSGSATLDLQNPVLRNMNVLREIFNKLSMIPGVSKSLEARLPQDYNEKLQEKDTVFRPISIPITINQGVYFFDRAVIESQSFAVIASGKGDMLGNFQGEGSLLIEPELSHAMMAGVNELQYLSDSKGQLQIPLIIQGVHGQFSITPNVSYVVSKLAASKTQEVLTNFLQKRNGTSDQTGQTPAQSSPLGSLFGQNSQPNPYAQQTNQQSAQQGSTGGQGLLGQLLTAALESKKSGSSSQQ